MKAVLADTGPLVAFLDRSSQHHRWAVERFSELTDPLLSCQPVVTEALFLLKRGGMDPDGLLQLIQRGDLLCQFDLSGEVDVFRRLLRKYQDLPATLADVCLVRMSELRARSAVLTLDRDFTIYRRNGRGVIPLIAPFA